MVEKMRLVPFTLMCTDNGSSEGSSDHLALSLSTDSSLEVHHWLSILFSSSGEFAAWSSHQLF